MDGETSFDEVMTLLDDEYWFLFYNHNNVNLFTEVGWDAEYTVRRTNNSNQEWTMGFFITLSCNFIIMMVNTGR